FARAVLQIDESRAAILLGETRPQAFDCLGIGFYTGNEHDGYPARCVGQTNSRGNGESGRRPEPRSPEYRTHRSLAVIHGSLPRPHNQLDEPAPAVPGDALNRQSDRIVIRAVEQISNAELYIEPARKMIRGGRHVGDEERAHGSAGRSKARANV